MGEDTGRVALVTGGSGWIGAGIARQLAGAGHRVAVHFHTRAEQARHVVDDIAGSGGRAVAVDGDITDPAGVRKLVAQVEADLGPMDILVNNAIKGGVPHAPIEEQRWEHYLAHLEFCLKGPLLLLQAVLPGMKAREWGRVINIGSEVFDLGDADNAQYVSAKGAMVGLTRSWATELGPFGISVNSVVPGWTPREKHGLENGAPTAAFQAYHKQLPLRRIGTPDDMGAAVAYLCSEAGGFVTGQRLSVNGGMTRI